MAASGGMILSTLSTIQRFGGCSGAFPGVLSQVRHYAARKGTREKMKKKKVKVEVKKISYIEKLKSAAKVKIVKPEALIFVDEKKPQAMDDVYFQRYFKYKVYPFAEAIQCHRENFHPTVYNKPNSLVNIFVELNMQGVKKTKPVEAFHRIISMRNAFDHGEERKILVFCKLDEQVKEALDNGATLAGGSDIVKLILSGEISLNNYDTVIAHPNIMPEILTLRGLMKKKHPSLKSGTLGPDIKGMLRTQLYGIKVSAKPYDNYPEYGHVTIPIGNLNMDIEKLEENLQDSVNTIMKSKPKRPGSFITRITVRVPPSLERLQINHNLYIKEEETTNEKKPVEDDAEEEEVAVAVPL